jgi:uncharacterized protein (TIRG00374 family)
VTVRKGIALFAAISLAVSAAVLLSTADRATVRLILSAKPEGVLIVLGLMALAWLVDGLRFCALARAAQERIGFRLGVALTFLNYFGSAITPMQSGGGPFQVYVLYRNGVPIGKGVAITLTRTLLTLFILGFVVPFALVTNPQFLAGQHIMQGIFSYVVLFVLLTWAVVVLSLLRPQLVKRLGSTFTLLLKRIGIVKPKTVLRTVRRINHEIDNYSENFRLFFSTGRLHFAFALICSVFHLLLIFSVLPVLIWAVSLPVCYVQALMAQALFLFVLYFVPTPGGSGVAEGGGAVLFRLLVPLNMAGVMAIGWRFFTEYLAIAFGAVVAVRLLGWGLADELLGGKKDD